MRHNFRLLFYGFFFSCLAGCDFLEISENHYSSYSDLEGVGEPGNWLPSFMPVNAVNIREKHKVDTGSGLVAFQIPGSGNVKFSDSACTEWSLRKNNFPPEGALSVEWWPSELSSERFVTDNADYVFYKCERQAYLAIKKVEHRSQIFFWRGISEE